jgi:archaemetzincin
MHRRPNAAVIMSVTTEPGATDGPRIAVWWIGEGPPDEEMLEVVRRHVAGEFDAAVTLHRPADRPAGTLDARRRQHSSREVLRWLVGQAPADGTRLLGITNVDLFIPILTFVFGEAQLEGPAAVVSYARLSEPGDRALTTWRLAREAVHELGHTFGLVHCGGAAGHGRDAAPCVMSRSASVRAVDLKSTRLCPDCRARHRAFLQDGLHVYREYENPDR